MFKTRGAEIDKSVDVWLFPCNRYAGFGSEFQMKRESVRSQSLCVITISLFLLFVSDVTVAVQFVLFRIAASTDASSRWLRLVRF